MLSYIKYFWHFILVGKTRQKLLLIAMGGLLLSAFALTCIQGLMDGLQESLIARSKSYHGVAVLEIHDESEQFIERAKSVFKPYAEEVSFEWSIELLLKNNNRIVPVKIHGVDYDYSTPWFLKDKDQSGFVLGTEVGRKLKSRFLQEIQYFSPGIVDDFLGDLPRMGSTSLSDYLLSDLSEIDEFEGWVDLRKLQNTLRMKKTNAIRLYNKGLISLAEKSFTDKQIRVLTWEEQNPTLVFALNLETTVMFFLFVGMSLLVSIAISTGLLIFFRKIKRDLVSLWILGAPIETLYKSSLIFLASLSVISCLLGLILGGGLLFFLERFGHIIVPDVFVERSLPVSYQISIFIISFIVPFLISLFFSMMSIRQVRQKRTDFLSLIRMP